MGEDLTSNQEALIWKVAGLLFRAPGCLTAKEFREQYLPQFLSDAELQEIQGIYSAQHDAPGATAALERPGSLFGPTSEGEKVEPVLQATKAARVAREQSE